MNISRKKERNVILFKDVEVGQVYEVCNIIYLKINPIYSDDGATIESIILETGEYQENFLDDTDCVTLLNATLIIEE